VAELIPVDRMTLRYLHYRDPQEALWIRLRELAGSRVRYGYRRLTVLLKREGWPVAHAEVKASQAMARPLESFTIRVMR
jgi:transposase InsO family protein